MLNGTTTTTHVHRDDPPRREQLTEAIARAWLDACAHSEMTQADFARSKGISPQCLSGWKRKLLRMATRSRVASVPGNGPSTGRRGHWAEKKTQNAKAEQSIAA
jgi:hypothetical protein